MNEMAPITDADPSVAEMEARVARFATLRPTDDYVDAGIPGCERTTYRVIGAQPSEGSRIPGIRKWPEAYLPKIYDPTWIDEMIYVSQSDAEEMARRMARVEGLFAGISSAGALWVALQVAKQVENATIVFVVCDRGDRYLSTGVFPA